MNCLQCGGLAIPSLTEYNDKYQAVHYRILTSNNKSILERKKLPVIDKKNKQIKNAHEWKIYA